MNPLFDWLIKSSISIALLYIVFKLTVSRDKIFIVNRFVLLGVLAISAVLPLTDIPIFHEVEVIPKMDVIREFVAAPIISSPSFSSETISTIHEPESIHINIWVVFYLLVILLLSVRLLISIFRVVQIIRRSEKQPFQKIILAIVKDFIQPFSFLQHIIISEKDYSENKDIVIAHEYAHIKNFHAIDLLICELFTALHWFNPFMWLLRRDLKLIHEYQADQAVLNKGIDAKKYQLLVLEKAVGERRFALANHFTQKPILKRIKMMHRKKENYWKGVKLILFAPAVLLLLQAFARPEILSEKIGEIVPSIIQKDSSEVWLDNWVDSQMKILVYERYDKTAGVLNIVNSGMNVSANDKNTIAKNNVFIVMQNRLGELLVEDKRLELKDLRSNIEAFLKGENKITGEKPNYKIENLPYVGNVEISQGLITYRNDLDSPKSAVEAVMKSIGQAVLNVRKEVSNNKFNQDYFSLPVDKKKVIDQIIPIRFNIWGYRSDPNEKAESNNSGNNKK